MVATPAQIGFVMEEWRRVVASSGTVKDRYGDLARESEDPIETFFENTADAQKVADARQALLSKERRRFTVQVAGVQELLELSASGTIPIARYIDQLRGVNRPGLVCDFSIDLAGNKAGCTVWG